MGAAPLPSLALRLPPRARADVVKNNLDPVWTTPFIIDFFFEETQTLRFRRAAPRRRRKPL